METKIKIDKRGKLPGTAGWVSEMLKEAKITFSETKRGESAAFISGKLWENQECILLKSVRNENSMNMEERYNNLFVALPYPNDDHPSPPEVQQVIFDTPLSQKAKEITQEFISKVIEEFQEEFEK